MLILLFSMEQEQSPSRPCVSLKLNLFAYLLGLSSIALSSRHDLYRETPLGLHKFEGVETFTYLCFWLE
jgi:hypothetical protein